MDQKINLRHWTLDYYNPDGTAHYKAKKSYDNELAAQGACFFFNTQSHAIHKAVAYKCEECGRWHVGHNSTVLTDSDREKILVQYKKWQIVNMYKR